LDEQSPLYADVLILNSKVVRLFQRPFCQQLINPDGLLVNF
jgi:hypothetical protein